MKFLFALLLFAASLAAQAQDYPNRPIRLVVPYPPSGLTDVLGRVIADRLGNAFKQPVAPKRCSHCLLCHVATPSPALGQSYPPGMKSTMSTK